MTQPEPVGSIVWQRVVDTDQAEIRWQNLAKWYGIPSLIAVIIAAVAGGLGAVLGVLILLGGIGLLLVLGVAIYNKNLASNPEIRLVDGFLIQGRTSAPVAQIESWSTAKVTTTSQVRGPAAVAKFRMPIFDDGQRRRRPDGGPAYEVIGFGWAEMTVAELDSVRDALAPHIGAPWVPIERLTD